jgi:hypothetical protein
MIMDMPVMEPVVKEKKPTGTIVGAVAAIVLCGLTGLCLLCPASVWIFLFPDSLYDLFQIDVTSTWGILPLCLSVVFIAIGVAVPIVLLRKKKPASAESVSNEPLPPAA